MSKKIEVVIDRKRWRTGAEGKYATGKGITRLRNETGYKCCLGFIVKAVCPRTTITGRLTPEDTEKAIPGLSQQGTDESYVYFSNTELAAKAMEINDDGDTSPKEKEKLLRELFKPTVYRLKFVGKYPELG